VDDLHVRNDLASCQEYRTQADAAMAAAEEITFLRSEAAAAEAARDEAIAAKESAEAAQAAAEAATTTSSKAASASANTNAKAELFISPSFTPYPTT